MKRIIFPVLIMMCVMTSIHSQNLIYTLEQCVDTAVNNNLSLRSQLITVAGNELNLKQLYKNRIPTLNGNVSEGLSNGRNFNTIIASTQTNTSTNLGLNSSLTIYNGFKNNYTIKQNDAIVQASKYDAEVSKNNIITSVIDAYLQVLYSYEAIDIAEEQLRTSEAQVNQTQNLLNVGKVAETNMLQIKSQNASDKSGLVTAQNNLMINKINLFQIMDIPVNDHIEFQKINIDSFINVINFQDSVSREGIYQTSLKIMPEIKSSTYNIQNNLYGLKVAKADILPKLSINAGISTSYYSQYQQYNYTESYAPIGYLAGDPTQQVLPYAPGIITTPTNYPFSKQLSDNFYKSATLTLSIPIFNNYTVQNKIKLQQLAIFTAKLNDQLAKNKLRKSIEQAYTQFQSTKKKYLATKEQTVYAQKSYESVTTRFKLGIVNPTDLQVEKNNYLKSLSDFLQSKYDLLYAAKMIEYYTTGTIKLK